MSDSTRSHRQKRKRENSLFDSAEIQPVTKKKIKYEKEYISASDIYNYLSKDSLVDWLKLYDICSDVRSESVNDDVRSDVRSESVNNDVRSDVRSESSNNSNNPEKDEFTKFILQQGRNFEKRIVEKLKLKFNLVSVSEEITKENCEKVKNLILQKIPIIHSAPFINEKNKTRGVVDLLVHSSILCKLVDDFPVEISKKIKDDTYYIIDIKFSTLPLRADGIHLLNSGHYNAYKGQVWLYTQALSEIIDKPVNNYAFLLGRGWSCTKGGIRSTKKIPFDKLGCVNFSSIDFNIKSEVESAMNWIKELYEKGSEWSINNITKKELYPNLCVDSGNYNKRKAEIASAIKDISQIWYCGTKNREIAFSKGVKRWDDQKSSAFALGITGVRAKVVDEILKINKQNTILISPSKINSNIYNWRNCGKGENEIFVDFETFIDCVDCDEEERENKNKGIFMIGIWDKNKYINFTVKDTSAKEEIRIMKEFTEYLASKNNPKVWFWHAEQSIWERRSESGVNIDWADMSILFRTEPIVIKDCFRYGLKEIAKTMQKHGMISSRIDSKCQSGLIAAIKAYEALFYQRENKDEILKDIEKYNTFDVKILKEILEYLRANL